MLSCQVITYVTPGKSVRRSCYPNEESCPSCAICRMQAEETHCLLVLMELAALCQCSFWFPTVYVLASLTPQQSDKKLCMSACICRPQWVGELHHSSSGPVDVPAERKKNETKVAFRVWLLSSMSLTNESWRFRQWVDSSVVDTSSALRACVCVCMFLLGHMKDKMLLGTSGRLILMKMNDSNDIAPDDFLHLLSRLPFLTDLVSAILK